MNQNNVYVQYAKNYGVTVAKAICDRDWPMDLQQCCLSFEEATGRFPTEHEIKEMNPDHAAAVREF